MTSITFNNLSKADGSALVDQNNTIIQASVFGPVDVPQSKINYEEAIIEVLFKPKVSVPVSSQAFEKVREVENLIKCIFKEVILTRLHPRTSISILVQEIHDGGTLLSSSVNAACCALIDAGVPMKTPVAGVSLKLDKDSKCQFEFVFDNNMNLITILTKGFIGKDELDTAIKLAQDEAKSNFDIMRNQLRERFT